MTIHLLYLEVHDPFITSAFLDAPDGIYEGRRCSYNVVLYEIALFTDISFINYMTS
jgi:hypothetical protein